MYMIKKIYLLLAGIILMLSASSCDSIFRDAPFDKLAENEIWGSEMLLNEYTAKWYRNMDNGFYILVSTMVRNLGEEFDPWFGDQITVGRSDWYQAGYGEILKGGQVILNNRGKLLWENYYTQIRSINKLMENEGLLPERVRTRLMGEAHFFRAYYYYLLLRRFGGVLLIDHPYNPLENPEKFPRASYEEMVEFITKEAETAAGMLPEVHDPAMTGRATKGAALMLKAKTYFWASGVKFQNAPEEYLGFPTDRSLEMMNLAAAEYDRVMGLNIYNLIDIPATDLNGVVAGYRNIFLTKNSIESIWEVQHSEDGDFMHGFGHKLDRDAAPPSLTGVNCAYNPTQNHVDEYRMANGKRITERGSGYDAKNPYEGRDWRFYANILYDGSVWKGTTLEIHYRNIDGKNVPGKDLTPYGASTSASNTRTGYYMAKFLRESQQIDNDEEYASSQNYIIWRFAELLLDYAEIDFKNGRIGDAMEKVNRIRRRVHMPELTSLTWDDIMNERRVELAFEKTTYWDLFRYGTAEQVMCGSTNPLKGCRVVYDADGNKSIITNRVVNGNNNTTRYFNPRQYYYPIAWDDIRYHGIPQNPDWVEM
ncbi:MAG: RagB/SusD family nutrient uptake outer membrane protein [Muribaculaceae bacterium]|nr:RagB/SusD family nutrient uptake outer membrane protein [Muribaculaceae bacterium]